MLNRAIASLAAIAFGLAVTTPPASAQVMNYPPGQFFIGGYPFTCGNATVSVVNGLGDLGKASPGQLLALDASLNNYPVEVIGFVFAHECAHFMGQMNEDSADAMAIQMGKQQGWISPYGLQQICASVYFSAGSWTHFPGPMRCQRLMQFYSSY
ncbi:MAG: hypothetical protein B7Y90_16810 [Alphaproteobacteria bacterium 32-64-14]|nr:MAG: hypothetical protein B7Y90_16810 [Alphaproteobacteria bacterium 32-64-14]